jgi:hypothetical protein
MLDMLRRSLGEQISIETVLGAGLWPTFADPNQLENVLLNLTLNARAAMPEGGCLTIETANTYLDDAYARGSATSRPGNMWSYASPARVPAFQRKLSVGCSSPFSPPSPLAKHLGWDSPWSTASSSSSADMCASTARTARAPPSRSTCRA